MSESEGTAFDIHYGDVLIKYGSVLNLEKAEVPRIVDSAIADRQTCDRLQDGDVIIADTAEDSAVGKCTELCNSKGKMVFSGLHTMPLRPMGEYASGYLGHYLNSSAFHSQLLPLMQGIKVISISRSAMADTTMTVPSVDEQRQIGAFFDRLDSLITLHQRKYDKLCVLKKSMLDKMFPKGGSLYPEIRFAGFTDPWEQRKLGELCSFSKGCGYSKNDLRDQGTPIILYGRLYTNYETQIHSVDTFVKPLENSVYSEGGEVIIPASGETAEDISIASVVEKPGIILGGDLNVITSSADIDPVFLALELSYGKPHFDLAKRAQGKSVVHIHNEDIANVFFGHPNIAEQRRIGAFFDRLDSLITLHQRKLELLRNIKKSMLDKMFV